MVVSKKMLPLTVQFALCWSSERCVANFEFCSVVVRVPQSLPMSSEGIQWWYAPMPSARQYDRKYRIRVRTPKWPDRQRSNSENNPKIVTKKRQPGATAILCSNKPSHALNYGACFKHGDVLAITPRLLFSPVSIVCVAGVSMGPLQNLYPALNLLSHHVYSSSREVANVRRIFTSNKADITADSRAE